MISGPHFRSACLPWFQPRDKRQALMWSLVSATGVGILSSCIRFLPTFMWLRHREHISYCHFLPKIYFYYTFKLHWADHWSWTSEVSPTGHSTADVQRLRGGCKVLSNRDCHGCLVLILEGIVFCFLHTTSRAIPAISCRMQRKLYDTARVSIIVFFKPCVNTQFLLQGFLTPFPCEVFHLWPTENITL